MRHVSCRAALVEPGEEDVGAAEVTRFVQVANVTLTYVNSALIQYHIDTH